MVEAATMEPLELRDRTAAERWLYAGLCLMRVARPAPETIGLASHWIHATLEETASIPPPGTIADIGQLVTDGELDFSGAPFPHERLRGVMRSYEDQVLGRLVNEGRIEASCDAVMRAPKHLRPMAIALFVSQVLQRANFRGGVSIPPGVARHLTARPANEVVETGLQQLREGHEVVEQLARGYEELVRAVRSTGTLIGDAEVFALENLDVLRGMAQRLEVRQILDAAQNLSAAMPRRIKPARSHRGTTPTRLDDESAYPTGGFASVANSGAIENLVISELMYMEDDAEVDLFDVRYAEGELLFYTRDESVFVRNRRAFHFILMPNLVEARFKDANVDWQRLVLAMGMVVCCIRRLTDWLDRDGLLFRISFVQSRPGLSPLSSELALMRLLLKEWIDKDLAVVEEVRDLATALRTSEDDAQSARADAVVLGMGTCDAQVDRRLQLVPVAIGERLPLLGTQAAPDPELDTWLGWTQATLGLLQLLA